MPFGFRTLPAVAFLVVAGALSPRPAVTASLPPAPYQPLQVGTVLDYGTWKCEVYSDSRGVATCLGGDRDEAKFLYRFVPFGRLARNGYGTAKSDVYCPFQGRFGERHRRKRWVSVRLTREARRKIKSLWPLRVGNQAEFPINIHPIAKDARARLHVSGVAEISVMGRRRPVYVIKGATRGIQCPEELFHYGAKLSFDETWWYDPAVGAVVRYQIRWQGTKAPWMDIQYALVGVTRPAAPAPVAENQPAPARPTAPSKRAPAPAPAPDTAPPRIDVTSVPETASATLLVTGRVKDASRVAELRIDDRPIPVAADGSFRIRRAVPVGSSVLRLSALDEWGNKARKEITVMRRAESAPTPPAAIAPAPAPRTAAMTEKRRALVIGNSRYPNSPLRNSVNDARLMAGALKNVGFDVELLVDATQKRMRRSVIAFGQKLQQGGVGLFYYSGHGISVGGENYLIPIDAKIEVEDHVAVESLPLNQVLARMGGARNRLNIVVMDACRNNPYARSFRSATRGLSQTLAPSGTFIAYATAPGDVASDGAGDHSPYTAALAKAMPEPGVRLEGVFKRVRKRLAAVTGGRQVPWTASSITGEFYFRPSSAGPAAVTSTAPVKPAKAPAAVSDPASAAFELAFWKSVERSGKEADFRAYLKRYPNGVFADLARNRIADLKSGR